MKYFCIQETGPDCREANICDPFADCVLNTITNAHVCRCRQGFTGDGIRCMEESEGNMHILKYDLVA